MIYGQKTLSYFYSVGIWTLDSSSRSLVAIPTKTSQMGKEIICFISLFVVHLISLLFSVKYDDKWEED